MKRKAFTLVELMIVVVIIGILATLVALALSSASSRAKNAKAIDSVKKVESALTIALAGGTVTTSGSFQNVGLGTFKDESGINILNSVPQSADGTAVQLYLPSTATGNYVIRAKSVKTGECWFASGGTYSADADYANNLSSASKDCNPERP